MSVIITIDKARCVLVRSPWNSIFIAAARLLKGEFDYVSSVWRFPLGTNLEAIRAACWEAYGDDGNGRIDQVHVVFTASEDVRVVRGPVTVWGRTLATAAGVESGVKINIKNDPDLKWILGAADSGGTVENWETVVEKGTTIQIRNFPTHALKRVPGWKGSVVPGG